MKKFHSQYIVTIGDINYAGHMGNERALVIFQDARLRMLSSFGCSEVDIGENKGIILVETKVKYLKEVFLFDELQVEITVSQVENRKFVLDYLVIRKKDEIAVFQGMAAFLCFDYSNRKVTKLPLTFVKNLSVFAIA